MNGSRIIVTGAAGFVGLHLLAALDQKRWSSTSVFPTSKTAMTGPDGRIFAALDIADPAALDDMIQTIKPTHVIHLAALPSIAAARADFDAAWQVNVLAPLNLARTLLRHTPECALIFASSAEVYGATARSGQRLDESALLAPTNEYAATKAAADLALGAMAYNGLKVTRFRPFNHTGPGQTDEFVVPAFASQIARIEAGLQPPIIRVGNLDARRDFLDVRDVVDAYVLAIEKSDDLPPGTILNIASGMPRRIKDMLDLLLSLSQRDIAVELDPARQRPNDTPIFAGDATLARKLLGWTPRRDIQDTLLEILNHCRRQFSS